MTNSPFRKVMDRRRRSRPERPEPEAPAVVEAEPAQLSPKRLRPGATPRDWVWFLGLVEEAKEDRKPALMHPSMVKGSDLPALARHVKRWNALSRAPGGLMASVKVYTMPPKAYRECFLKGLVFERNDEVEPEIPTGIVEVWRSKSSMADQTEKWKCDTGGNALRSSNAYMRLGLPPGMEIRELLALRQLDELQNDDYRMEDIIHVQRRAGNRELKASGDMAAEVDKLEKNEAHWLTAYIPHAFGVILPIITGVIFLASRN